LAWLAARVVLGRFKGWEERISAALVHALRPGGASSSVLGRFDRREEELIWARPSARVVLDRFEDWGEARLASRFPMRPGRRRRGVGVCGRESVGWGLRVAEANGLEKC
jgi:hypothetical protein